MLLSQPISDCVPNRWCEVDRSYSGCHRIPFAEVFALERIESCRVLDYDHAVREHRAPHG